MAAFKKTLFAVLLSAVPAVSWACYPHPNLRVCWDLQEGRGVYIYDSSVNLTTASMMGTTAWVPNTKPRGLKYTNMSGSNTFANTGEWMVSFPALAGSDIRSAKNAAFDFTGSEPFSFGITVQIPALRPATDRSIVGSCDTGIGWELYLENGTDSPVFRVLGVAGHDFLRPTTDTNPHRYFVMRNSNRDLYLFVDGVIHGTSFLASSIIIEAIEPLILAGTMGGLSAFEGKLNHFSLYTFDFVGKSLDELKAFAKNEYLYWQGLDNGAGVGE